MWSIIFFPKNHTKAGIAQLGERQTEDLKVACSIHAHRIVLFCPLSFFSLLPMEFRDKLVRKAD